ncbi:hypothetical protein D9V28_03120 [Mycetocola zhadangensis]|uniref:Uncharacterized protein n=1 Tax=Mycetocola zhadangensis TaxID=1164595 RepID=A0A3L7JBI5_9MICO|nr:hypothetical protein D9V28_03120 [Mycetocola zhadangensis]
MDSWLASSSTSTPVGMPSRLQQIADARAADISVGAVAVSGGIVTMLLGAYWSVAGLVVLPVIILGIVGAGLVALGNVLLRRARSRLPNEQRLRSTRGPRTARGGVVTAASLWGVMAVVTGGAWFEAPPRDGLIVVAIGFYLFFALLLVVGFVVPATILGRARESLRRAAAEDAAYRALLEHDRLTWSPRYGDQMFGPL